MVEADADLRGKGMGDMEDSLAAGRRKVEDGPCPGKVRLRGVWGKI